MPHDSARPNPSPGQAPSPAGQEPALANDVQADEATRRHRTLPGDPSAVAASARTSITGPDDWFRRGPKRDLLASLDPGEASRLLRLKSRAVVLQGPGTAVREPDSPTGELYVQFSRTPTPDERSQLAAKGLQVVEHVTRHVWKAEADRAGLLEQLPLVVAVEPVAPQDKLSPLVWQTMQSGRDEIPAVVDFYEDGSKTEIASRVSPAGVSGGDVTVDTKGRARLAGTADGLLALASDPGVRIIAAPPPPNRTMNVDAQVLSHVDDVQAAPYELTGTNIAVMVRDGGEIDPHGDFGSPSRVTVVDNDGVSDHSTHVAGTIGGSGAGDSSAEGMAPGTFLYSYDFDGDNEEEMEEALLTYGARLSNHSYGHVIGWSGSIWNDNTNLFGNYTLTAEDLDAAIGVHDYLVVKSAGNDRNDDGSGHPHDGSLYADGYYDCLGDRSSAKNLISLGAATDSGGMTPFSSWGPTDDGRIKPDITANGDELYSTEPGNSYGSQSGTSMSAPTTTGILALMLEQFVQTGVTNPPAGLVKAILLNTADDAGRDGPDYQFGWGIANAKKAVDLIRAHTATNRVYAEDIIQEADSHTHLIEVPAAATNLHVMLYWTDPAGNSAAEDALVNDLNITLRGPGGTVHDPYTMPFAESGASPALNATTGTNDVDNVEQVDVPAPASGTWTATVTGVVVPTGDQEYILTTDRGRLPAPALSNSPAVVEISNQPGGTNQAVVEITNTGEGVLHYQLVHHAPSPTDYTWRDSSDPAGPQMEWEDISVSGTDLGMTDDNVSLFYFLGFSFPYFGNTYDSVQFADNGVLSLSRGWVGMTNEELPSDGIPDQSIAPFWDDLNSSAGGEVRYLRESNRLIVSWLGVPRFWDSDGSLTFQAILYESGHIRFQYKEMKASTLSSATVGLQDDQGSGPVEQLAYNETFLRENMVVEFTPPGVPWLEVPAGGGELAPGASTTLTVFVDSAGLEETTHTSTVFIVNNSDTGTVAIPVEYTVSTNAPEGSDEDGDGLPNEFEIRHSGSATGMTAYADDDADGIYNLHEYIASTDPTNALSVFELNTVVPDAGGGYVIRWPSASNRVYGISWMTNLTGSAAPLSTGIVATPPENVYTDTTHNAARGGYYRIDVRME